VKYLGDDQTGWNGIDLTSVEFQLRRKGMVPPALLIPVMICSSTTAQVDSVRIVISDPHGPVMERIAAIAQRHMTTRSGVHVTLSGDADFRIEFATDASLPPEGYAIRDAPNGGILILGEDEHSILYGLGKFLRTSGYDAVGFIPSSWRGQSAPQGSFRAIYAATHFNNFYQAAPVEEVCRYLEDLALWGANAVLVCIPTFDFTGLDDPALQKHLDRLRDLFRAAKGIGLKTALGQCPNQGFKTAPVEILATPNRDPLGRKGNLGFNCCPSKPGGREYLMKLYQGLFSEFKEVGLDYTLCWPYDEGGCGCDACFPWGAKAFPELSKNMVEMERTIFPDLKVILSTWVYDKPPAGEWEGLAAFLEKDHAWLDAIMCDDHEDFPRYPLDHVVPAGLPLYNFPEISMWGRNPWGSFGANPLPGRYETLWKQTNGKVSGGMPYSEGIYEDMNKTICFQFYWNRDTPAEDTLREYVAYEFNPGVVEDVLKAVHLLEEAWVERGPKSLEAFNLLKKVDGELPSWARESWRWRILYLRGLIDSQLVINGNKMEGQILKDALNELTTLYHAQNAFSYTKPLQIQ